MAQISEEDYPAGYALGQRAVWVALLVEALQQLGYHEQTPDAARQTAARERLGYIVEREAAIAVLRDLCATWGDNDWTNEMPLAEIIDQHLWVHLERGMVNDG